MTTQHSSGLPLIDRASGHGERTAIIDDHGRYSYNELLDASAKVAHALLAGRDDVDGARVCFLVEPSLAYVATQWGAWRAGGVAVPMCVHHPAPELAYVIDNSDCEVIIADATYAKRVEPLAKERGLRFLRTDDLLAPDAIMQAEALPTVDIERPAMLIYTSGTTSKPKGVVLTHHNLRAQITSLVQAWGWREDDHIIELLPLHHLHGVLNVVCCALWSGATCEMMPRFDADAVWDRISGGSGLTLFMAVPTIYARLVQAWKANEAKQAARSAGCQKLRLMVSGSAALPVPTLEEWRTISGHTLLERYGMTEIGMAISNPLDGERRPGHVGMPLPGVNVRLVDDKFNDIKEENTSGQILIKGDNVFGEYWRNKEATQKAFTDDGWFKTGDVAVLDNGYCRILGRDSVDIIKTGGYKVSALEIEASLGDHPAIAECAVVGVPDDEWGERVGAAVVLAPGQELTLDALRAWGKERLAVYKVPSRLLVVDELPRNPMGKVTKPQVAKLFQATAVAK